GRESAGVRGRGPAGSAHAPAPLPPPGDGADGGTDHRVAGESAVRWDAVEQAGVAALSADDELLAILGGARIYPSSASRKVEIPSVEYMMISDLERESLESIVIQIDYWARGRAQAAQIERRIRHLHHADTRRRLGGIEMATLY